MMNIGQVEENVQTLAGNLSRDTFIYELLAAYGLPKASITRLQQGSYNLSKIDGEIIWKKKLYFRPILDRDLHGFIDTCRRDENLLKHAPRFFIVTDFKTLLAYDSKTDDTLDIPLSDLPRHFDFFLPWAGMEKAQHKLENPADVKAAEKMAKLYDHIRQDNPHRYNDTESLHELNVFLSRLLFCYFAEDTEIFPQKLFTNSVTAHTQADGSDLGSYLDRLFDVLDAPEATTPRLDHRGTKFEPLNKDARADFPGFLQKFPYVNGGLFAQKLAAPNFSARARKMLIECGSQLNWADINPDIFGSMIQAVVHPDQRGGMGMHYTSVTNIMKVIEPLFLNELYGEFERHSDEVRKLQKLLERLRTIRVFDPACGSGNFLIIAYKELRKLEIEIFKQLQEISEQKSLPISGITLSQFFGIELDDFAHEIAILSLWLAEHQMNVAFKKTFGQTRPALPLREGGKVVSDNAARVDWCAICPPQDGVEIFILGNPPYLGARNQSDDQKDDVRVVFSGIEGLNSLDYIACWFLRAAQYISGIDARCGFVSTNSICQGEQVSLLWPHIFDLGLEISFAHQSFKWTNNAKNKAVVTCVIVGLRNISDKPKYIYAEKIENKVYNISPYLTNNKNIIVYKRSRPLNDVPLLVFGNQAIEGGNLIIDTVERDSIVAKYPEAEKYFRRLYGADDFINGLCRWCIWVRDDERAAASKIPPFNERFKKVYNFRKDGGEVARSLVNIPYRFRYVHEAKNSLLLVPRTTSERREYIPIGFLDAKAIVTDAVQVIYDPDSYVMGVLSSRIHLVWVKAIGGRLKTDYRYSNSLCYNTFPIPKLTTKQTEAINFEVLRILDEREAFPDRTMAELYDPKKMPESLRAAHGRLDSVVERCFRAKPFSSDEERLEYLLDLYEELNTVVDLEVVHA